MKTPLWIKYGGPAWSPFVGRIVRLPERVYPVVDVIADNYGQGLLVSHGGLDFAIDADDLGDEPEISR